jgi:hypothetical protein
MRGKERSRRGNTCRNKNGGQSYKGRGRTSEKEWVEEKGMRGKERSRTGNTGMKKGDKGWKRKKKNMKKRKGQKKRWWEERNEAEQGTQEWKRVTMDEKGRWRTWRKGIGRRKGDERKGTKPNREQRNESRGQRMKKEGGKEIHMAYKRKRDKRRGKIW